MAKERGRFIVVEGVDGAGKTTLLKAALEKMGERAVYFQGFTHKHKWDQFIHTYPTSFGYYLDFLWKTYFIIKPALRQGKIILQDRYIQTVDTFLPDAKFTFNRFVRYLLNPFFLQPDLYVYLHVQPEVSCERLRKSSSIHDEYHQQLIRDTEKIRKRQQQYDRVYQEMRESKILIDTTDKSPKQILNEFLSHLCL